MTKTYVLKETDRYLNNAKEILQKAKKRGKYYSDEKYVKLAGRAFFSALLCALDKITTEKLNHKNIKGYYYFLAKRSKEIQKHFKAAHDILYRLMGNDGVLRTDVVNSGINEAEIVINWVIKQKNFNI